MIKTIENTKDLISFIKLRREELGISQAQLAQLCNLSLNGISKLESSKDGGREVKLSTLLKLSKFLGFEIALKVEE
jgi:transcriptional regulator with XRE-family HTH domain